MKTKIKVTFIPVVIVIRYIAMISVLSCLAGCESTQASDHSPSLENRRPREAEAASVIGTWKEADGTTYEFRPGGVVITEGIFGSAKNRWTQSGTSISFESGPPSDRFRCVAEITADGRHLSGPMDKDGRRTMFAADRQ